MPAYRSKTIIQASFWAGAVAVGGVGVFFDQVVHAAQTQFYRLFEKSPLAMSVGTLALFLAATALVVFFAPAAKGSGIPQALRAMMISLGSHQIAMKSGLISLRTAAVKILSAAVGIMAGASIGREGPTVQISTSIFAWIGSHTKKWFPHTDFHSYLVAGAAAGVSAAFNTPLAGISFALEEMAEGSFARIKQTVMVSVIIAGITTQAIVGYYVYFGRPTIATPDVSIILPAILIGLVGGVLGGLFARSLAYPVFSRWRLRWWQQALICGLVVATVNFISGGITAGTGYEITRRFMDGVGELPFWYPLAKLVTTAFSFMSGMAGGIFSPSLAIGAGVGSTVAQLAGFPEIKTCALLGMVAFFTGTVQAPLTAVIIVMEMTDKHVIIIPLMIAGFVAQGVSKLLMPTSLYHHLAQHMTISGKK